MTLEEYYIAKDNLKAPAGLKWHEEIEYYAIETKKLQQHLSPEDLEKVTKAERRWQDKMQSSVG